MNIAENFRAISDRVDRAAQRAGHPVTLLAVSKMQPAAAIANLASLGQTAFAENYVQEALTKRSALSAIHLQWHLIGPLQSNKARDAATNFDWLHTLDRAKLVAALGRHRPTGLGALQVLIQVNIDDEASKSGCSPDDVPSLAAEVVATAGLALRGLMVIPAPVDRAHRCAAFARTRELFERLRADHPQVDTLSMGMSDDFELAIAEGSTLVRVGSALFGPRLAT